MSHQLRCPNKMHAIVTDKGLIEVACRSVRCGWRSGVVVLHYFDPSSKELTDTKIFRAPPSPRTKEKKRCP